MKKQEERLNSKGINCENSWRKEWEDEDYIGWGKDIKWWNKLKKTAWNKLKVYVKEAKRLRLREQGEKGKEK